MYVDRENEHGTTIHASNQFHEAHLHRFDCKRFVCGLAPFFAAHASLALAHGKQAHGNASIRKDL